MKIIFSLSHTLFLSCNKGPGWRNPQNFTKDPTLHKKKKKLLWCCNSLLCSKGVAWLGRTFPNKHKSSSVKYCFIAQSETQCAMNTTMIQIGKTDLYFLSTLSLYCVHGRCHNIVWCSSSNRGSRTFRAPTHHCLHFLAVNTAHSISIQVVFQWHKETLQ